ncbi:MAG TPA: dTDP-4-dehydrorhamnose 3,5-epimerase [Actinomycetota bacterium]|jgi:dTDP-4-dehydrorhamnose 3,5-epimerase|nr:dTDP-4-dehydrorhamnose 3,5-epimerase [Actinomycetota bacterium]
MRFTETKVAGAFLIEPEPIADERGFFARTWCREEFADHGLTGALAQANISFNHRKGTLRGLHYQAAPHAEAKLVRVTRGAIWDLALDLRRDSPTYLAWFGAELDDANRHMLYVPEGCAHGFLTLTDDAEVAYQMSAPYVADAGRGVRFDDPAFGIEWPGEVVVINERDRTYPDFSP